MWQSPQGCFWGPSGDPLNMFESIILYVCFHIVKTCVFFAVCHQKAEPPKCLQPRAASCRTGSSALVSAEAPQHCHLQGVVGGWGRFAVHRHGLLWRRWSVPKAQRAEREASAWEPGGGVVCSDRHGSAGTVGTQGIPRAPRWQEDGWHVSGKWFPRFIHGKKEKTFKNSIYDVYLGCLALALEHFRISKYYIEADMDFIWWLEKIVLCSCKYYSKIHFKGP